MEEFWMAVKWSEVVEFNLMVARITLRTFHSHPLYVVICQHVTPIRTLFYLLFLFVSVALRAGTGGVKKKKKI